MDKPAGAGARCFWRRRATPVVVAPEASATQVVFVLATGGAVAPGPGAGFRRHAHRQCERRGHRHVVGRPSLAAEPSCIEGVPKGSPDGRRVLLFRACFDTGRLVSGIYLSDAAGSYRTKIADGFAPDWNPIAN